MCRKSFLSSLPLTLLLTALSYCQTNAGSSLQISYGANGIETLSYRGVQLENVANFPSDAFHIWHMKTTDLNGNVLTSGQYGWGESNNGRVWNSMTRTWDYSFQWGTISVNFVQSGDNLDMGVKITNFANSGVIFDGATIYPFVLHFPQLPKGFADSTYDQLSFNTTGPSVLTADFGSGQVVAVVNEAQRPLYSGFKPAGIANSYFPIISGTSLDNMAPFFPHNDRPVFPGQSDSYTVSLRFAPSETPLGWIAADAYRIWSVAWPAQLNWPDRRTIGTLYLASSPDGDPSRPAGYPNNPRRYFNDSNPMDFDIRTADGLAKFQNRILGQASDAVQNLQRLNAQGAITWDLEGQQYPHSTSYACAPDQIAQLAPEMETAVMDSSSRYSGMKLDDAYFQIVRNAGFRVGVCVRPQRFTLGADGTASQVDLPTSQIAAELIRKIRYAHDRWGATLFYLDSTVEANGANLDPAIFQQVAATFPDSLVMPEESTPKYYGYTAPFRSFIFHNDLGTPSEVYNYYPKAFSVVLVNDVDPYRLAEYRPQLTQAVRNGDILMVHAGYWQDNNPTVMQIYADAAASRP